MTVTVRDNPDRSRFEVHVDDSLAGFADYRLDGSTLDVIHTEVDDGHEGEGLGGLLTRAVLDSARERGLEVVPTCPFVRSWIEEHPEYADLVPADRRGDLGR